MAWDPLLNMTPRLTDGIVLYEGCCYSNAVGLWQLIIASTGCGMCIYGYFGSQTSEGTGGVQQDIDGGDRRLHRCICHVARD